MFAGRVAKSNNLAGVVFDDFGERREDALADFYGGRVYANNLAALVAGLTNPSSGVSSLVPNIINFDTSATPGTETSFGVSGAQRYTVSNRGTTAVQVAFAAGQSGSVFFVIPPGTTYDEQTLPSVTVNFYVQSPAPSQRLEIVFWT